MRGGAPVFFVKPPLSGQGRFVVSGTINSCSDFKARKLFLQLDLLLPEGATLTSPQNPLISTSTFQSSTFFPQKQLNTSFPFEFDVALSQTCVEHFLLQSFCQQSYPNSLPLLALSVVSEDFWGRQRVLGYSWISLSLHMSATFHLNTWKPHHSSFSSLLSEFLLGSPTVLRRPSSCIPTSFHAPTEVKPIFSFFGIESKSSGNVSLFISTALHTTKSLFNTITKNLNPPNSLFSTDMTMKLTSTRTFSTASPALSETDSRPSSKVPLTNVQSAPQQSEQAALPPKALDALDRLRRRHADRLKRVK
ncbi:hypothetical protein RCL1_003784 [Eukaryota sp. TZLM3-RCL]